MPRYAWVLEVRPGYEEEYVRRHQDIWPDMVEAGIRRYQQLVHLPARPHPLRLLRDRRHREN